MYGVVNTVNEYSFTSLPTQLLNAPHMIINTTIPNDHHTTNTDNIHITMIQTDSTTHLDIQKQEPSISAAISQVTPR